MPAERLAHRRDDADLRRAPVHAPAFRRLRFVLRNHRTQSELRLQPLQNLPPRQHHVALPRAARVERHELDEAQHQRLANRIFRQRLDLVIVDATNDHRVHLHRGEAEVARQPHARQQFLQSVAPRDAFEILRVERVATETHALQTRVAQGPRLLLKQKPVRRHREIHDAVETRQPFHQLLQVTPQQRLATRQPDFLNAQPDGDPHQPLDFLEAQDVLLGLPLARDGRGINDRGPAVPVEIFRRLRLGQAVQAAEIATVRHAHPQVAHHAPMRIHEQIGAGHFGVAGAGAALVVPRTFGAAF